VTCRGGVCSSEYHVTIRYADAQAGARHTMTGPTVVVVGPPR
jgi:hypothetical protein